MNKEILAKAIFNENCEYQSSVSERNITIPQQIVRLSPLLITNENTNRINIDGNYIYYYNDTVKVVVSVFQENSDHPITTGRIEFYFQQNGQKPELINKVEKSCELSKYGTASILFKPKSSGKIFARYIDDNEIYTAENNDEMYNIELRELPVSINFIKKPLYPLPNEEINIKVKVTDALNGANIEYGDVTFMHYTVIDDIDDPEKRIPKIIGNPVPIIDGYAEINYMPVQSLDENEITQLTNRTEYIRAVYNYNDKHINHKWKYYQEDSVTTTVRVESLSNIYCDINTPLEVDDMGMYIATEGDVIDLAAVLTDKDNQIITPNDESDIIFHIKGVHAHPKEQCNILLNPDKSVDDNFIFIDYEDDISASINGGYIMASINNLLPGYYTIFARNNAINLEEDSYNINIDSNIIHLYIGYEENDYNITLYENKNILINETVDNIYGIINGLNDNQKDILNNQSCYFYIPKTHTTYTGTLIYEDNILKGVPNDNISFNIADNYSMYMYIPNGIYTNNIESHDTDTKDFYLPFVQSNNIDITCFNNDTGV